MKKKTVHREILERYCSHVGENVILIKKTGTVECLCPELCRGKDCECKLVKKRDK